MENSLAAMRPEIVTEWSPRNLPSVRRIYPTDRKRYFGGEASADMSGKPVSKQGHRAKSVPSARGSVLSQE